VSDSEVPYWAYDVLIAMLNYEDEHGNAHEGWTCFHDALNAVPAEARDAARTIDAYRRQKPMGEQ
jgi:hypothetical protein